MDFDIEDEYDKTAAGESDEEFERESKKLENDLDKGRKATSQLTIHKSKLTNSQTSAEEKAVIIQCSWRLKRSRNLVEAKRVLKHLITEKLNYVSTEIHNEFKANAHKIESLDYRILKLQVLSEVKEDEEVSESINRGVVAIMSAA